MSIETETNASAATDTTPGPAASARTANQKPELWRRRGYQITAGLVALAVLAAVITNNLIARQFTADGAVRQYLSALESGDANTVWNVIQVSAPTQPVAVNLTNQAALRAALAVGKPDIRRFAISGDTQLDSNTTVVAITYDTSAGTHQSKVTVQRSAQTHFVVYPVWFVVITPALFQITLPKGSNGVTIDGKGVALPEGAKSTIAVLPLAHKVQFNGTQILAPQAVTADALFGLDQTVPYKPQLSAAGLDKAKSAVKAAFAACAQQTTPNADSGACPQSIGFSLGVTGQWQLLGDPTQDLTIVIDKDMNLAAVGHYQMAFLYRDSGYQAVQHLPASGAYSASLVLASTDLTVASIQPFTGLPPLERSTYATDQAAKDLVAKAFKQCVVARAQNVADCPQLLVEAGPTNIRWSMTGDPLAGATVTFDANSGLFTVHGNFNMTASYTWFGYPKSASSLDSAYNAYLFWNGQNLQLVTISGSSS